MPDADRQLLDDAESKGDIEMGEASEPYARLDPLAES